MKEKTLFFLRNTLIRLINLTFRMWPMPDSPTIKEIMKHPSRPFVKLLNCLNKIEAHNA